MKYTEMRPLIQTGDLVLSSGSSAFSKWIKDSTNLKYSHAAICVWGEHIGREVGRLFLYEATGAGSGAVDFLKATVTPNVNYLRKRLNPGAGEVAIRHLIVDRTPEMIASLKEHIDTYSGRPYETNKWQLMRAVPWIKNIAALIDQVAGRNIATSQEDFSEFFCWEAAMAALQAFGVVPPEPPANHYSNTDCAYGDLPLLLGAKLAPLETIEFDR